MYFNKKNINRTTPQVPSKDAAFERRTHTHTPPLCRLGLPHWTLGWAWHLTSRRFIPGLPGQVFSNCWEGTNGKEAFSALIWVVSFSKIPTIFSSRNRLALRPKAALTSLSTTTTRMYNYNHGKNSLTNADLSSIQFLWRAKSRRVAKGLSDSKMAPLKGMAPLLGRWHLVAIIVVTIYTILTMTKIVTI